MAIQELTDNQIREMTVAEKDRWWLENVYRGDMPQLTIRSAVTGMILGAVLSLSNLYVGAKIGAGFGVAITAVVLAYAMFHGLSRIGVARDMTLLENNCMQSIATAAGYMTSALTSSLPAYMAITGRIIPFWQSVGWLIAISVLGVLFAFPLKRRLINDEQLPFPEGQAAGRVMEALHSRESAEGMFKARVLGAAGVIAAFVTACQSKAIMKLVHIPYALPSSLDGALDWLWAKLNWTPSIAGISLAQLGVRFGLNSAVFAIGGLLGMRIGLSFLVGAILNYCVLGPIVIGIGDITMAPGKETYDIRGWAVWSGVAILTTASLLPFFINWRAVWFPLKRVFSKRVSQDDDPLASIELPLRVFVVGIPLIGIVIVAFGYLFFGISPWLSVVAIPLVFIFTLIAANTTGHTGQTPTGAMGKLTQLTFAVLAPRSITTNVMAAGITSEASLNASSLLQDIKPGYMLGAKPRQQAIGHVLGILAGSVAATYVAYRIFIPIYVESGSTPEFPMPSAAIWTKVAQILLGETQGIPASAGVSAVVFGLVGMGMEIVRRLTGGRFPLSPIGIGFAMVIPFSISFALFAGAFVFWIPTVIFQRDGGLKRVFADNRDTLCSGLIAGASILGILDAMLEARGAGN